ncbi:hypothetical protein ACVWW1_009398 [Bradyrhizobium sp. JR3.5]
MYDSIWHHIFDVVPASAARPGAHNHRCSLRYDAVAPACFNNGVLWLMVWTAPYGISVPE